MSDVYHDIINWMKNNGIDIGLVVSGTMGGFVKTNSLKKLPIWQRLTIISTGAVCATYLTPLVISIIGWSSDHAFGLGFLIGYMGLSVTELFAYWLHNKLDNKLNKPNKPDKEN